jgi:hypothetical protein
MPSKPPHPILIERVNCLQSRKSLYQREWVGRRDGSNRRIVVLLNLLRLTMMNSDRLLRQAHDIAVLLPFHCERLRLTQMENRTTTGTEPGPKPGPEICTKVAAGQVHKPLWRGQSPDGSYNFFQFSKSEHEADM